MASVFLVAAAVTIVPAMGLLWALLARYEGYFQDARVFVSLVAGFFAGLVVAFLENVAFQFDSDAFIASARPAQAFTLFVLGYAFVETAAKTAVLGFGRFRARKDTPYYGAAVGIGFGAMLGLQATALAFQRTGVLALHANVAWAVNVALIVLSAFGSVLVAGATGVWVGKGSADGKLWRGLGMGWLLALPALAFLWFQRPVPAIVPTLLILAYGLGLALVTQRKVLDRVVPPEIRDQVLKDRRRAERERMRGG